MIPSVEQLDKLRELINSRGFISCLLLLIVGWVVYIAISPIVSVPSKLDVIISKLDQVIDRRVAVKIK